MAVPFGIGKVIDIIYSHQKEGTGDMVKQLKQFCQVLLGIFLLGAAANTGRVYLMQTAGKHPHLQLHQ